MGACKLIEHFVWSRWPGGCYKNTVHLQFHSSWDPFLDGWIDIHTSTQVTLMTQRNGTMAQQLSKPFPRCQLEAKYYTGTVNITVVLVYCYYIKKKTISFLSWQSSDYTFICKDTWIQCDTDAVSPHWVSGCWDVVMGICVLMVIRCLVWHRIIPMMARRNLG